MHFNKHTATALLPVLAVMLVSSAQQTTNQFSTTAASVVAEKFTKKSTGKLHKLGEQHDNNNNNNGSQHYNKKFSFMNEKSSKVSNVATVVNESETDVTATTTTTATTTSLLNVINSKTEIAGKQDVISPKPYDALWPDDDLEPYEEFTLLEEIPPTQTTQTPMLVADQQHIYKVPKPLLKMRDLVAVKSHGPMLNTIDSQMAAVTGFQIANASQAVGFQIMAALFDHSRWSYGDIERNVSAACAADMKIYLRHMRLGSEWALKVMDSSGRFGSEFLFGNDFWMGSKRFCGEVDRTLKQMNRENRYSNRNRRPQMRFYVSRIAAQLEYMFAGVSIFISRL
jgi:Nose resistant-to-fluoxetine protein, N-terminal domain